MRFYLFISENIKVLSKKKCFGYLKENSFSWKIWKHVSLKKENNVFLLDKRRKGLIWKKQEIFLVKTNIFFL